MLCIISLLPIRVARAGTKTGQIVKSPGLVAPDEFQFNVVIPSSLGNGDQSIAANYDGAFEAIWRVDYGSQLKFA